MGMRMYVNAGESLNACCCSAMLRNVMYSDNRKMAMTIDRIITWPAASTDVAALCR